MTSLTRIHFRHHLLRMQKELRAQSAKEKRQLLDLRKRIERKHVRGHETCDEPACERTVTFASYSLVPNVNACTTLVLF